MRGWGTKAYSGFNTAFKKYFDEDDPIEYTNGLAEKGKIVVIPFKGGTYGNSVKGGCPNWHSRRRRYYADHVAV